MQATANEQTIRNIVQEVLTQLTKTNGAAGKVNGSTGPDSRWGVFGTVDEAVAAAQKGFEILSHASLEDRKKAISIVKQICDEQAEELGKLEFEETKIGRLEHKIAKLKAIKDVPGVEFLRTDAISGSHGLMITEYAPFGVIGAITPVTHSLPTITGNAVSMIAGGNTLVVNPHPSGRKVAAEGVRRFNEAIRAQVGIDNCISLICEPTLETAQQLFKHRKIALICVTGGPAVARAALNSGKRAVVAGPGNPPVVVDETADLDHAARCIIQGAAYDNNLLCIAEKEVFVVDSVFEPMMEAMSRAGAARLNHHEVDRLTGAALQIVGEGADKHHAPRKELLGHDAVELAAAAGKTIDPAVELVFGETTFDHPFVQTEQMMPFVPFVRCPNFEAAVECAQQAEHGYRHTSIIHSRNVRNMTIMARAMDTTLFVKNGPCMAALGLGGEGYLSFSIAGPTGEGVTTPLTFTRERRCSLIDDLFILGR